MATTVGIPSSSSGQKSKVSLDLIGAEKTNMQLVSQARHSATSAGTEATWLTLAELEAAVTIEYKHLSADIYNHDVPKLQTAGHLQWE